MTKWKNKQTKEQTNSWLTEWEADLVTHAQQLAETYDPVGRLDAKLLHPAIHANVKGARAHKIGLKRNYLSENMI